MQKRRLGKTNMYVNPVGLGCMGFSHAYGIAEDRDTAIQTMKEAHALGYDFYDTAECYTGENADGSISYNEDWWVLRFKISEMKSLLQQIWC